MTNGRWVVASVLLIVCLAAAPAVGGQPDELVRSEMREFLLSANVIAAEPTSSGVTKPWRLTLGDDDLTHDALFQTVDERSTVQRLGSRRELNFVDSYRYNIAAYELSEVVGLGHMMPVTVERKWRGETGSLSWWIDDIVFDEATRLREGHRPEDIAMWSLQQARMQVFAELVHDTDRNQTNQLYTSRWELYMIDFSRAFRLWNELRRPRDLLWIDRQLFGRLKTLAKSEVETAVGSYLTGGELNAILKRRDLLVEHFQRLIRERGEASVLHE